jgi:hypothetical protein
VISSLVRLVFDFLFGITGKVGGLKEFLLELVIFGGLSTSIGRN